MLQVSRLQNLESKLRLTTGMWNCYSKFCIFVEGLRYSLSLEGWWVFGLSLEYCPCNLLAGLECWTRSTTLGMFSLTLVLISTILLVLCLD